MISMITGLPGEGKTLFAVRQLLRDLIESECYVVTNIPLILPAVNEYVSKRREGFVLDERLRCVNDDLVYEFYRVRSGGLLLDPSPDFTADKCERMQKPEFIKTMKGHLLKIAQSPETSKPVHYYIDEAHNYFSAREWASAGRGIVYYASQHRHLHDNITLITQVMDNVEKQLRGLVGETYVTKNGYKRSVGWVRMPENFKVSSYYGNNVTPNSKPYSVTKFKLDVAGIASCYKTTGALGVHSEPEKPKKRAPLPFWVIPATAITLLLVVFLFFSFAPSMMAKQVLKSLDSSTSEVKQVVDDSLTAGVKEPSSTQDSKLLKKVNLDDSAVRVSGVIRRGRKLLVRLNDDSVLDETHVAVIGMDGIRLKDGTVYRYVKYYRPDASLVHSPVAPAPVVAPVAPAPVVAPVAPVGFQSGAWATDAYGVQRIVDPEATKFGPSR